MNYKLLGKSGLRVSEIALGTMTFGTEWGWGADYDTSKKVFEAYANAEGNFIDTANRYTEGTSEKMVGEFINADRDHFVLATKYSLFDRKGDPNFAGNHRKNMVRSVNESLKRLKTDFIDLLWVHAWDGTTPVDEMMRALDDLVTSGKIQYIGISDTPAWVVAQANTMADLRGWSRFVGLQVEYSLIQRTPERDLLPMAKALDLAVAPWASLAGGALSGKYLRGEKGRVPDNSLRINERSQKITQVVVNIADEIGVTPSQVALNWCRQKNQVVIPIVGARSLTQIEDSLGCVNFKLSPEQITQLDEVSKFDLGFPHDFLASENVKNILSGETWGKLENHRS
ncbi:aryl-alcohol dehydrogenase-like predicted oxidoreductase [Arcicella aurantiaca]|uniref:Aryl-alcohol dehydrogenase-like predicted oxidoreductase n=1 Tax=Arcicella aurantiaca TaxID=591202 RepID=A0A316EF52_9BACT|nr:aldo/keto reductase [Arcicella aurantiaca]PWK28318.1 aryl-alcohol dehydrogenase-like predicted oxidoreductase [Arcicella aurantiaca]